MNLEEFKNINKAIDKNENNISEQRKVCGICEIVTLVFIILKLCGLINWSWWLVFLPVLVPLALYSISFILLTIIAYYIIAKDERKNKKE